MSWSPSRPPIATITASAATREPSGIPPVPVPAAAMSPLMSPSMPVRMVTPSRAHSAANQSVRWVSRERPAPAAAATSVPPRRGVRSSSVAGCPRSAATRAASNPAGPPPITVTATGSRARPVTGESLVSWPDDGSPTQDTSELRLSRTWQTWLHRMHGRGVRPACTVATRSGSAICARVISTASATPSVSAACAMSTSTTLPCRMTGTARTPAPFRPFSAARMVAVSSRLKPGSTCMSGRVAATVKIDPRTTTR